MSLHFLSRAWIVEDLADGTRITLAPSDFTPESVATLADELFDLVQGNGGTNLYLDFTEIRTLPGLAVSRLFDLDRRLRHAGGRLVLVNLGANLAELLQVVTAKA